MVDHTQPMLFEMDGEDVDPSFFRKKTIRFDLESHIWTKNKARLIERYLNLFVQITKHGTYIDGFAGPQEEDENSTGWSARLVLESEPQWFRNFYLFDKKSH
jgi:hypothetical protein